MLALATLAAVIFAWLNFVQRSHYDMVDDGVAWSDSPSGIEAWKVAPDSPAAEAGIRAGDLLLAINDARLTADAEQTYLFICGLYDSNLFTFDRLVSWLRNNVTEQPPM